MMDTPAREVPDSKAVRSGLPMQGRETQYGSDSSGLICGFVFSDISVGRAIDAAEALDWLQLPAEERANQFIWLHFNLSNVLAQKWMRGKLLLTDAFFDALSDDSRSTRIENAKGSLIPVINDVVYDFSFALSEISTLWLTVQPEMLVSARVRPLRSIDRLRQTVRQGCEFGSPVALLIHLLHDQGDEMQQIVRKASMQVDGIEDSLLAGSLGQNRADLGRLRRVFVRLQRLGRLAQAKGLN